MLIKFQTQAHADIVMFGDVAQTLLHLMGHSGTVPGALLAEDIPQALARLQSAVTANPQRPLNPTPDDDSDSADQVSLAHRALPLIQLLQAAAQRGTHVMWDE